MLVLCIQGDMQEEVFHTMTDFEAFLEKKGFSPNDEQRRVIYADKATVVSAGAGSGKTTVLAYRFLRLVMEGKAHVDEILTLTFTNKASNEMYARIYSLLRDASSFSPALHKELELFKDSTISTLDSFSSRIARTSSLDYSVVKDFDILSEKEMEKMGKSVLSSLMEEKSGLFSSIVRIFPPGELYERIFSPLSHSYSLFSAPSFLGSSDAYSNLIGKIYKMMKDEALYLIARIKTLTKDLPWEEIGNPLFSDEDDGIGNIERMITEDDYSYVPRINLQKGRGIKEAKKDIGNLKSLLSYLPSFSSENLIDETTLQLFDEYFHEIERRKKASGKFTYSDIADLALKILSEKSEVRSFYKRKFKYIMIDEFQDNSPKQRDLLFILSEKEDLDGKGIPSLDELDNKKLFFVGDDKQSIYAFRGADVSVFNALKYDMIKIGGEYIQMDTNYRSNEGLINHFNTVFDSVFSFRSEDWEDQFALSVSKEAMEERGDFHTKYPYAKAGRGKGIVPRITLCVEDKPGSKDDGEENENIRSDESEAEFISRLVREEIVGKLDIKVKDGVRKAEFSDIAILFSKGSIQIPIEKVFRRDNIPYVATDSNSVTREAMISDFISVLRLVYFPGDKLSYIAVLRSPFVRISDDDLALYGKYDGYEFPEDGFLVPEGMSEEGRRKIDSFSSFFSKLLAIVGRRPMTEVIDYLFYNSGYSSYLVRSDALSTYQEHYEYIWQLATSSETFSDLVTALEESLESGKTDDDKRLLRMRAEGVELMTIYKSKGLEFPVVIVAGASSTSSGEKSRFYVSSAPDLVYLGGEENRVRSFLSKMEAQRLDEEKKRVLYVALTRAVDHLFIVGTLSRGKPKGKSGEKYVGMDRLFKANSLAMIYLDALADSGLLEDAEIKYFDFLESRTASGFERISNEAVPFYQSCHGAIEGDERPKGLKARGHEDEVYVPSPDLPQLKPFPFDLDDVISEKKLQKEWGSYMHLVFETFLKGKEFPDPVSSGLPDGNKELFEKAARSLLSRFESSDLYLRYIKGNSLNAEEMVYAYEDGEAVAAVVDLVVFSSDYNLVIDYKSDRAMDPEYHKKQVTGYVRAMEELYEKKCYGTLYYMRDDSAIAPFWDSSGSPVKAP